ncbi:MAG: alpha-glucan family phosphorylase [Actinobacteria bacterium]|nr:alpha-glucan family phosphorylase [Actinomycetota bacterium]
MYLHHAPTTGAADLRGAAATLALRLPEPLRPLADLAYNLRWSWDPEGDAVFGAIAPRRWEEVGRNPVRFLVEVPPPLLDRAASDATLAERVESLAARVDADLTRPPAGGLDPQRPTAFLCAEYAVHDALPLYAGGLGVLAGDILKEASDLAMPMVAVGLLYRYGYFHQRLDRTGWQHEFWVRTDAPLTPAVPVTGSDGQPLEIQVPVRDRDVHARIWRVDVGRVPLYLLDTNLHANHPVDRWITARLYEGDPDLRLAQYTVLGVGGVRALRALGIDPGTVHMNEGHPALAALELIAGRIADGHDQTSAMERIRERCIFTTHTPVPAGNETYPTDRFLATVDGAPERAGLDRDSFLDLACVEPEGEPGMTPIALRLSRSTNAVSQRHGEVARQMWNPLYPGPVEDVPITHVTNGVHLPTWLSAPMRAVLDRHLGDDWTARAGDPETWAAVDDIPDTELWEARRTSRTALIEWVRERSIEDRLRRGEPLDYVDAAASRLDPDALTIGFARRVASYKRLYLLGSQPERVAKILDDPEPVQLFVAGKAHPKDDGAKSIVRSLFEMRSQTAVAERVSYLEDYDLHIGALLTSGCDVWLNVPRPPLEASGTSGMKVVLNGGLNLSVLDGWWAEGYDRTNGWAIEGDVATDVEHQDHEHGEALFNLLEKEVVPTFYDRDEDGIPRAWIAIVKNSLRTLGWRFTATRMMREYRDRIYRPA